MKINCCCCIFLLNLPSVLCPAHIYLFPVPEVAYVLLPNTIHGSTWGSTWTDARCQWSVLQVGTKLNQILRELTEGTLTGRWSLIILKCSNSLSVNYVIVFIYHALQSISTIQKFAKFLFCLVTVTRPLCARSPDRLLVTGPGVVLPELVLHLPLLHPQPVGVHSEAGGGGGSRS